MPLLRRDVAIDLGTTELRVWARGRGVVAREPSVVAVEVRTGEVVAVGGAAAAAAEARPGEVSAERILAGGAITDAGMAARCLRLLLARAGGVRLGRFRVRLVVPVTLTSVERRAVVEAARAAGAGDAELIDGPVAAALGAGLPISEPSANVVVDVGGGVTQAAVLSLGGMVTTAGARVGGMAVDEAIRDHVRARHGVALGDRAVREVKHRIAAAAPGPEEAVGEVRGRSLETGAVVAVRLGSAEVTSAIDGAVGGIVAVVRDLLASCPPELLRDVPGSGMALVGGGALLRGLPERIADEAQVPVTVVEDPTEAVLRGAGASFGLRRPPKAEAGPGAPT